MLFYRYLKKSAIGYIIIGLFFFLNSSYADVVSKPPENYQQNEHSVLHKYALTKEEKENDLILKYRLTPTTKPGIGSRGTRLEIKNNDVYFFRDYPIYDKREEKIKISNITKEEIFSFIKSLHLFSKKDFYKRDNCNDGKVENIFIKISGKEKDTRG